MTNAETFWERHYQGRAAGGSGRANPLLVETAETLHPGVALDLGCGGGADSIWLAGRGWQVTAVDISRTVVARLRARADELGLAGRVTAEAHDLARSFPGGRYDLVSAQYFHSPVALPRAEVLRTAAEALRPGGLLLVTDHGSTAPWSWSQDVYHPRPAEVAAALALDPARFSVLRADMPQRQAVGPGGQTAVVTDNVLLLQRTGA